jgi:hypothetical protein
MMQPADIGELVFDYRFEAESEINLVALGGRHGMEIALSPRHDRTSLPRAGAVKIVADGQWHTARIPVGELFKGMKTVEALGLADTGVLTTPKHSRFELANVLLLGKGGKRIPERPAPGPGEADSKKGPAAPPGEADNKKGPAAPPGEADSKKGPAAPPGEADSKKGPAAPSRPYVSVRRGGALVQQNFEPRGPARTSDLGEISIRRGVLAVSSLSGGATGAGCVRFVNPSPGAFFSMYFRRTPYDLRRWPRVSFDFRIRQTGSNMNIIAMVAGGLKLVSWTGQNGMNNPAKREVGRLGAPQDDRWHHLDLDLLKLVESTGVRAPHLIVDHLGAWAASPGGGYRNPQYAVIDLDNFSIYNPTSREATFEWTPRTPGAFTAYVHALDQNAETVPPIDSPATATSATYKDLAPGVWHFHLRARRPDGTWTETVRRQVEIVSPGK